jgi:hypothetical protein
MLDAAHIIVGGLFIAALIPTGLSLATLFWLNRKADELAGE